MPIDNGMPICLGFAIGPQTSVKHYILKKTAKGDRHPSLALQKHRGPSNHSQISNLRSRKDVSLFHQNGVWNPPNKGHMCASMWLVVIWDKLDIWTPIRCAQWMFSAKSPPNTDGKETGGDADPMPPPIWLFTVSMRSPMTKSKGNVRVHP